jgi:hypothetical protein
VWQTQLKGRHADHNLIEYMPTGKLSALLLNLLAEIVQVTFKLQITKPRISSGASLAAALKLLMLAQLPSLTMRI